MKKKPVVLITGGVSLMGSYVSVALSDKTIYATTHQTLPQKQTNSSLTYLPLEITDEQAVNRLINQVKPDVVIHLAALSNIDFCELHPDLAQKINVEATEFLCKSVRGSKTRLVFTSSNVVFDGSKMFRSENETPKPLSAYGKTKARAEEVIQRLLNPKQFVIIRNSTLLGWQPKGARPNDVTYYLPRLARGEVIHLVNDYFFNPIYAKDAASVIKKIVENDFFGIVHVSGPERVTRFSLVQKISAGFGVGTSSQLIPVKSSYFKNLAPRPLLGCLTINRLKKELKIIPTLLSNAFADMKFTIPPEFKHILTT